MIPKLDFSYAVQSLFDDFEEVSKQIGDYPIVIGGFIRDHVAYGLSSGDIDLVLKNGKGFEFADTISVKYGAGKPGAFDNTGTIHMILDGYQVEIQSSHNPLVHFDVDEEMRKQGAEPNWLTRNIYERDFTINTIAYDIIGNKVIDVTGKGINDLTKDKILRCPISASAAIHNNPLIIARAPRLAIEFNLTISKDFLEAVPGFLREFIDRINMRDNRHYMKAVVGEAFDMDFERAYQYYESIGFLNDIPMGEDLKDEVNKRRMGITIMKHNSIYPIKLKKVDSENLIVNCFANEFCEDHEVVLGNLINSGKVSANPKLRFLGDQILTLSELKENGIRKISNKVEIDHHLYDSLKNRNEYRDRKRKENRKKTINNYKIWGKLEKLINKYKSKKEEGGKDDRLSGR